MRYVLGVIAVALAVVGLVLIAGPDGWDTAVGVSLVFLAGGIGWAAIDGDVDN